MAPATPPPMAIDLNATEGHRRPPQEIPADMHPDTRNLFDIMPVEGVLD